MTIWTLLFTTAVICFLDHGFVRADSHYVNEWAAEIPGGLERATRVAEEHGYRLVRKSVSFPDHYILERSDVPHRSRRSADHHTRKLSEDDRVVFVEQQVELSRAKRDLTDRDIARRLIITGHATRDPDLEYEWYIFKSEYTAERSDGVRADMGVVQVWQQNITGKGSVVTILDDGVEGNHSDLAANYDPLASYDFNGNDPDPSPRYDPTNENKHGTRCAGEIAMVANNNKCGVGIAFDCKIGGIRMLDGRVTDRMEGDALAYNIDHVHIYSASWGPTDDGKTVEGPGRMASQGLEKGIKEGRGGKGSLYVWASGNGGTVGDNCNADGYTSSIYTMSISTTTQNGNSPWYAEKCASTIASTYSSGTSNEGKVTSADLHDLCTHDHTGTSAAAPMAAGIIALVLEVNPDLTWRDMQHLVIQSARPGPLLLQGGWYINGAGYCVSLSSGFGLMNAKAMVDLAKTWTPVGEQHKCTVNASQESGFPQSLTPGNFIEVTFTTDGCAGQTNVINYLEHIQVVFDLDYNVRGKIYAEVESPAGTITPLFLERKNDKSNKGFKNWPLMSVHTWGENPRGKWKFRVADRSKSGTEKGSLNNATLVLYGTAEKPAYQDGVPKCNIINKFIELYSEGDPESASLLQRIMLKLKESLHHPKAVREADNLTDVQSKMNRLQTLLNNNNDSIKNPKVQESLNKLLQELEGKKQE